jgi:hypothetical protein
MKSGRTAGEALMQAKVELAKEMDRRQGFLDGEDQKTLISFVLFGDPLVGLGSNQTRPKNALRFLAHPKVRAINDFEIGDTDEHEVSEDVLKEVKKMVASYLPGLDEGKVALRKQRHIDNGEETDDITGKKVIPENANRRMVVTMSKHVEHAQHVHHHYAHATLNHQGKIVKLALSK